MIEKKSRSFSIRFKLVCIVFFAVWGGATLNSMYTTNRLSNMAFASIEESVIAVAKYAAFNSKPVVVFEDSAVLSESLEGLMKDPTLVYGRFTNADGDVLAEISQHSHAVPKEFIAPERTTVEFEETHLHIAEPIRDQGEIVGYLFLGAELAATKQLIREDTMMAFGVNLLLAFLFTVIMMLFLSRVIFRPVAHLHASTKLISEGNFDIQEMTKEIKSGDELGELAGAFEEMSQSLSENANEILSQNKALKDREQSLQTVNSFLSTYLPKQFVESVLEASDNESSMAPQRQLLTVFFSDLQGFTDLTDQLDPESLFQLLSKYQNEMNHLVLKYDGTLDKYMGDGLMVFFGAPNSRGQQEDVLRCCLMALEMQNAMEALQNFWFYQGIESPLNLRIGIHTGFSAVGSFGTESRLDYTAIGPVVNIASRLEAACPPQGILSSHQTWASIHQFLETEEAGSITPKGLTRPMKTYTLKGIKPDLVEQLVANELSTELQEICKPLITIREVLGQFSSEK